MARKIVFTTLSAIALVLSPAAFAADIGGGKPDSGQDTQTTNATETSSTDSWMTQLALWWESATTSETSTGDDN